MGKSSPETLASEQAQRKRAEALCVQIERAFDGVPVPDASQRTLFQAEAWDDYRVVDQSRDHKGRWQDLPVTHLRGCSHALPHLDAHGTRFYLPAIMCWALRDPNARSEWLYESMMYLFGPPGHGLAEYRRERLSLLNEPQRAAIAAFVVFEEADEAVQALWRKHLGHA
ncbi:MAG: hypothetical protein Q8Q09_16145 [Deltaproteobacteria bacterium]|nr:hypothetical protein [Deltaproteobacteria bacterium]